MRMSFNITCRYSENCKKQFSQQCQQYYQVHILNLLYINYIVFVKNSNLFINEAMSNNVRQL